MKSIVVGAFVLLMSLVGCGATLDAHLDNFYNSNGGRQGSTPAPSPSASGAGCAPGTSAQTATVVILMANGISAGTSGPGAIAGYVDNAAGTLVAAPITTRASNTVQFFNGEQAGVVHSAIGLTGTQFPATFVFPSADQQPVGTTISGTSSWSSGLIPSACFSQQFTIAGSGTYLFGDYNGYDSGMRGVLVAQ